MTSVVSRAPQPAYERLADTLRDQILAGQLRPGDRLPIEPELSAQYSVSRSTVREALRVLASQKLVVTTRGVTGGTFVNQPGPEHVQSMLKAALAVMASGHGIGTVDNLIEVRHMLEVPAAGLAAERRTEEQLADLRSSLFDPRHVDVPNVFRSTRSFHAVVLDAANNPMLAAVTTPIFLVLQERFARDQAGDRFWRQVDKDHRTILALIEARDAEGARQAQAEHLTRLRNTYIRIDRQARREARGETGPDDAAADGTGSDDPGTAGADGARTADRPPSARRTARPRRPGRAAAEEQAQG